MTSEFTAAELSLQNPHSAVLLSLQLTEVEDRVIDTPHIAITSSFLIECDEMAPLSGAELALMDSNTWPRTLTCSGAHFIRLLDRIYLPDPLTTEVMIPALNACALIYECLIDAARNTDNIARLADIIVARSARISSPLKILDFGCGTGLSAVALGARANDKQIILSGLDNSPRMRKVAAMRGVIQVPRHSNELFDGILASYVLHAHTPEEDLDWIANALLPRGVFAANWLHGSTAELQSVIELLVQARSGSGLIIDGVGGWNNDPILVFVAHE